MLIEKYTRPATDKEGRMCDIIMKNCIRTKDMKSIGIKSIETTGNTVLVRFKDGKHIIIQCKEVEP